MYLLKNSVTFSILRDYNILEIIWADIYFHGHNLYGDISKIVKLYFFFF